MVPGLAAMGMIVLVIGSVRIIGEQLKKSEIFGVLIIIIGIFLIALSELSISGELDIFYDIHFTIRITVLTAILSILWMGCRMAGKKYKKVIYRCDWCGQDLHDISDKHSMAPRPIYNDYDRRQYCSIYCARRGYAFYNEMPQPEPIPEELFA